MLNISIVIITHNRYQAMEACLHNIRHQTQKPYEIIVVDNGSDDGTAAMLAEFFPEVHVIQNEQNLGIPTGRNQGYELARGDICVTIDDDAVFESDTALACIKAYFEADANLCCVSFEVRDAQGCIVRNYIPRRDRKIITHDSSGAFFVGTGHAMHRARFIKLGGFWERLGLYFGEEPDLSYRILEAGYTILHSKSVAVIHYESSEARPSGRRIYYGTRNTPWIALRNLPWYCVVSLTFLSWGYYFLEALKQGALGSYAAGIRDCLNGIPRVLKQRQCVSPRTITLLKHYSGIYWY